MEKAAHAAEDPNQKPNKKREQQLADDLMTVRLREAEALADLKEMKQKVMELETQVSVGWARTWGHPTNSCGGNLCRGHNHLPHVSSN